MALETETNAQQKQTGFIKSGYDRLVDDKGLPIEFQAWNMIRKTYSDRVRAISNQGIPEASVLSVIVSRYIAPIKDWAPAQEGTNASFSGIMSKDFPELSSLTDKQLEDIGKSLRRHEIDE